MELMTKTKVAAYVKEKGLFPSDAILELINIGAELDETEGLVNVIYRVLEPATKKSLIIKQVMPYVLALKQHTGEEKLFDVKRLDKEVRMMVFLDVFLKGIAPEVYDIDRAKGLILMEDLSHLANMRFALAHGRKFYSFGKQVGALLGGLLFYTSDLYLSHAEKERMTAYFENQEAKAMMADALFGEGCVLIDINKPLEERARATHKRIVARKGLYRLVQNMGKRFCEGRECLCHNDLHVGNVMIGDDATKIIDCEFAGYAMSFMDLGRIASSFIVNYVSWLGMTDVPLEERKAMQDYDLQMIQDLFASYHQTLKILWEKYAKELPSLQSTRLENVYRPIRLDSIRNAALCAAFRATSDGACSYDVARIKDPEAMGLVQNQFLEIAEATMDRAEQFRSIQDFLNLIRYFAEVK